MKSPLKQKPKGYIVIEVYKGIPSSVKLLYSRKAAEKYERDLRKHINLEEDETGIFKI